MDAREALVTAEQFVGFIMATASVVEGFIRLDVVKRDALLKHVNDLLDASDDQPSQYVLFLRHWEQMIRTGASPDLPAMFH